MTTCDDCSEGTFSIGGAELYKYWIKLPPHFSTKCEPDCEPWKPINNSIISRNHNHSTDGSLFFWDEFKTDGKIEYTFIVDSEEHWDGLRFYIDGELQVYDNIIMISSAILPRTWSFDVTQGLHEFLWEYHKDFSINEGRDEAEILSVLVVGTEFASDKCFLCEKGTFANETGSIDCKRCFRNTYSENEGSSTCLNCKSTIEYSEPGQDKCTIREPCTENDYDFSYTECIDNKATRKWSLIEPIICDKTKGITPDDKPDEPGLPCPKCSPGTYRINNNGPCEYCEIGYFNSNFSSSCFLCEKGTAAIQSQYFENFDIWPNDAITSCTGECGTLGWRVVYGEYLDSGIGHLGDVRSVINITTNLYTKGEIVFNTSLICESGDNPDPWFKVCGLRIFIDGTTIKDFYENHTNIQTSFNLNEGYHEILLEFWKDYEHIRETNIDIAKIHSFFIRGVEGGADKCTKCDYGTYSAEPVNECIKCDPGFYNDEIGKETCKPCPIDTYSKNSGSEICKPCGANTHTLSTGSIKCNDNNCSFQYDSDTFYKLSQLKGFWGPVIDNDDNKYFISPCKINESFTPCDSPERDIHSYICQKTSSGRAIDIGSTIGYLPLETDPKGGLIVQYIHGFGCGTKDRYSNITFICDVSQVGSPKGVDNIENPSRSCHYEFEWRSKYACRFCTENDYNHYYTECEGGSRYKKYFWINNPRRCFEGIPLPSDELVNCAEDKICIPGTYLDSDNCKNCTEGRFSTGFNDIPLIKFPPFETETSGGWKIKNEILISGFDNPSWLKIENNFVDQGKIEFLVMGILDENEILKVLIDDKVKYTISGVMSEYEKHEVNVSIGTHIIKWEISLSLESHYIKLKNIKFIHSDHNKQVCTLCSSGFYSDKEGLTECKQCKEFEFTIDNGSLNCNPCPQGQYSFKGSSVCLNKSICKYNDWFYNLTSCKPGELQTLSYEFYEPKICNTDSPEPIERNCPPCLAGTDPINCISCSDGMYSLVNEECKDSRIGYAAIRSLIFSENQYNMYNLEPFKTKCIGLCGFSSGWRARGDHFDSGGRNQGEFTSILYLNVTINHEGKVEYQVETNELVSFIDNGVLKKQHLSSILTHVSLSNGNHLLEWIAENDANLTYIRIDGTDEGLADKETICAHGRYSNKIKSKKCEICPKGSYSGSGSSTSCILCPKNTIASEIGSSQCIKCGRGTTGNKPEGSTECITSCVFNNNDNQIFDYSPLIKKEGWNIEDITFGICSKPSICDSNFVCDSKKNSFGSMLEFFDTENNTGLHYYFNNEAKISILCEPNGGSPKLIYDGDTLKEIEFPSLYGCRKCEDNDYKEVKGICQDSKREITFQHNDDCWGNKDSKNENCNEHEIGNTIIYGTLGAFVGLGAILGLVLYQKRKVQHSYDRLMEDRIDDDSLSGGIDDFQNSNEGMDLDNIKEENTEGEGSNNSEKVQDEIIPGFPVSSDSLSNN